MFDLTSAIIGFVVALVLGAIFIIIKSQINKSGFDAEGAVVAANDVVRHTELFKNQTRLKDLRKKIGWLDPIYYYDIKNILKTGGDIKSSIQKYLTD